MSNKFGKAPSGRSPAAIIKHYEDMSAADIEAELRGAGVDPRPTIDAVTKLVNERLEEWRSRRGLHGQEAEAPVAA